MSKQEARPSGEGPVGSEELGHGASTPMWTACALGILAGVIATYGALRPSPAPWIIAAVVAVLAIVIPVIMTKMGLGGYTDAEIDSAEDSPTVGIT